MKTLTPKSLLHQAVQTVPEQVSPKPPKECLLRPLQKTNATGFWYSTQPIGHSKLDGTVARMCKAAGIGGFKTNHSLRATAATRLYQAGLDEQLIMETTGHQRLDGVRNYKRTSVEQQQVVSDILSLAKKPRNECSGPNDVSPPVHSSNKTTKHFHGNIQPNQGCSEPTDISPPAHSSKKTTEHFRGGTQPNQGNVYPEHGGFSFINYQNVTINLK